LFGLTRGNRLAGFEVRTGSHLHWSAPVAIAGSVRQSKTALLRECGSMRRKCYEADPKISKLIQKNQKQSRANVLKLLGTDRVGAGRLSEHSVRV
jgi:hypothetical protein